MSEFCSSCGKEMQQKSGVKDGKPWAGYFCSERGHKPKWLPTDKPQPPQQKPPVQEKMKFQGNGKGVDPKTILMAYAKDIIVAEIAQGIEKKTPFKSVIHGFRLLLKEHNKPYSVKFTGDNTEVTEDEFYQEEKDIKIPF